MRGDVIIQTKTETVIGSCHRGPSVRFEWLPLDGEGWGKPMIRGAHQIIVIEEKNQEVFHLKDGSEPILIYSKPCFLGLSACQGLDSKFLSFTKLHRLVLNSLYSPDRP